MSENNLYYPSEKAKKITLINEENFSEKYLCNNDIKF